MSQPDSLFSQRREIRLEDTDAEGIVYTPRIAHFVVEAVDLWLLSRLFLDAQDAVHRSVFASLSCTFLSPMRPGDSLEIRVALRRIGRSSLGFELVGHAEADDRLCWMAETVCVFVDSTTLQSRPIPTQLHKTLDAEAMLAVRMPFADRTMPS